MLKNVKELIQGNEVLEFNGDGSKLVTSLITDSRRVVPGALFFAIDGLRSNGNYYIEEAVDRGAVAIISQQSVGEYLPIDYIQVKDVRVSLAMIAKNFYKNPDDELTITGITGTNGKTTVSMLLQCFLGGKEAVGLLGTVRYDLGGRILPSFKTTPESVDVYALLGQMVQNGCKDAVMEISSHGIDQKRVHDLNIDIAVFLNLTQDHMDYHQSMESYYKVKKKLFTDSASRSGPKVAVVNQDCPYGQRLINELDGCMEIVGFGLNKDAFIRAENTKLLKDRTIFDLVWPNGKTKVESPLLGRYNISNLLAALAVLYSKGLDFEHALSKLSRFSVIPGRMERIDEGQDFNVIIDYAHTDDALKHACAMLSEITKGAVIVVFGCGGDRDRSKRLPMLTTVMQGSSRVFVTADNPRSESIDQIFSDMGFQEGSEKTFQSVDFIPDRKRAISLALDCAKSGDCVLIAGKGHETYQEFDGSVIPFDDRQVARELLHLKSFKVDD
ncbi:MAG: UDP-N-acetylmuramoyl-L-alanyl-D-glutamate--2,6-diaminopimelate ligase [Verrucomicrobiota bacterium]|nr:UDP-N-acetylmuramoyl-L-alanyl-D-glutamate--2,6-diaminopimelate ligase [Verrucomicrobiota bacterium]